MINKKEFLKKNIFYFYNTSNSYNKAHNYINLFFGQTYIILLINIETFLNFIIELCKYSKTKTYFLNSLYYK